MLYNEPYLCIMVNRIKIPLSIMTKKTEETKPQQATEGEMVKIPHEYLIDGVNQAVSEIKQKMESARAKYGSRYNHKNDYEEFGRRFGYNDPERIWEEYDRVWNKQSKESAIVRKVVRLLGDMARYYAINRMREDMKNEKK